MKSNEYVGWYVFSTSLDNQDSLFIGEIVGTLLNSRKTVLLVRSNAPELDLWGNFLNEAAPILNEYLVRKATDLEIALC